ncbi:hypothetical protein FRC07_004140 [Ceratobasidium sp. 392]|nr:hypothetical protein FRC07_004140 [Ceratobasidium sp. 392]
MALLAASGEQARLRGTTTTQDILTVSNEVLILSICLGLNVQFRFNNIFEVPLSVIADGHIIGFDSFHIYFKSKPVAPEELQRAQVLFNFLAIVRHFANLLGPQGVSKLVEEFRNSLKTPGLPDRQKVTRTRSRRYGLVSPLATRTTQTIQTSVSRPVSKQPLTTQDINRHTVFRNPVQPKHKINNTTKRSNRLKRIARIWNKENAPPADV